MSGIDPTTLNVEDVLRELESLYQTRLDAMRFGADHAWHEHTHRMDELEREYLRRFPEREIDPARLRGGDRPDGA
ncbi:MAG: DUF6158 family protein [Actinocatenispora sp.]